MWAHGPKTHVPEPEYYTPDQLSKFRRSFFWGALGALGVLSTDQTGIHRSLVPQGVFSEATLVYTISRM